MSSANNSFTSFPKLKGLRLSSHSIPTYPKLVFHSFLTDAEAGTQEVKRFALQKIMIELVFEPRPASPLGLAQAPVPDINFSLLFQALKRQSLLGLSFFNSILAHGDLRNNRLNQLSVNLWHLAQRHGYADTRTMVRLSEGPLPHP